MDDLGTLVDRILATNHHLLTEQDGELNERQREDAGNIHDSTEAFLRQITLLAAVIDDMREGKRFVNISHDLRGPLNGVLGYSKWLLKETDGNLNDAQRAQVQSMYDDAQTLLTEVNRIFEYALIEDARRALKMEFFALMPLVEEVITPLKKNTFIHWQVNIADPPLRVCGDRERAHEVLYALVSNAVKCAYKGSVSVSAERVQGMIDIAVGCLGAEIDSGECERFYAKWRIGRALIDMQGGSARIINTPGESVTIWFSLAGEDGA